MRFQFSLICTKVYNQNKIGVVDFQTGMESFKYLKWLHNISFKDCIVFTANMSQIV